MPAAIAEKVIEQVENEWASDPDRSARAVARHFLQKYGPNLVGERTIISTVVRAKEQAPKEPFPFTPWKPWVNPEESPEDTESLLQLDAIKRAETGKGLHTHEAKWGRKIRPAIKGLTPLYRQFKLVSLYAQRETAAYYLNKDIDTEALDAFLAYKPWLPENQYRYTLAIVTGLAEFPFFINPKELKAAQKAERKIQRALTGEKTFFDFLPESEFQSELSPDSGSLQFLPFLPEWPRFLLEFLDPVENPILDMFNTPEQQVLIDQRKLLVQSWASTP